LHRIHVIPAGQMGADALLPICDGRRLAPMTAIAGRLIIVAVRTERRKGKTKTLVAQDTEASRGGKEGLERSKHADLQTARPDGSNRFGDTVAGPLGSGLA